MSHDASAPVREEVCRSTRRSWRLFAAALTLFLTVPRMAQPGMFGDGLLYATIARNMSLGIGSLWAPRYTETTWSAFFEHPPLGFALQAGAFWLLGDSLVVERLFSLAIFGAHALIVMAIWRRLQSPTLDWLPLLFWLVPSIVSWSLVNNMLENVQSLFTSAAVLLVIAGTMARGATSAMACGTAAGVAMVAAVLTKGPAGLFPLAAIGVLPVIVRARDVREPAKPRSGRVVMLAGVVLATMALCAAALALYEPSRTALTIYLETQLSPSLRGTRGVSAPNGVMRHLVVGIVGRMALLLAVIAALGLLARRGQRGWYQRRLPGLQDQPARQAQQGQRGQRGQRERDLRAAAFFFAMACAASWPIALSPRLSGHYLLPSVPFFALGFAALAASRVEAWLALDSTRQTAASDRRAASESWRRQRLPQTLAAILIGLALLLPILHGPLAPRDVPLLRDLDTIGAAMPRETIIGACVRTDALPDWGLHTYVQRFFRVSLDPRGVPVDGWMLVTHDACTPPPACTPAARGVTLSLFRCVGS